MQDPTTSSNPSAPPTLCLIYPENNENQLAEEAYLGVLRSRAAVTTLETRVKIVRAVEILPSSQYGLVKLLLEPQHSRNLRDRLSSEQSVIPLSPKLSQSIINALASIARNHGALRAVSSSLLKPTRYSGPAAIQEEAIQTAMRAFGLAVDERAVSLDLVPGKDTGLIRIPVREDAVIQHDARSVPGYELVGSDITGRARFESDYGELEVITANRQTLEELFGVDLIYLNLTQQNLVMVQYKMLEPDRAEEQTDWIYRPDINLKQEIQRMDKFVTLSRSSKSGYRLNPDAFYLKFVKRDASLKGGSIITSLEHYKQFIASPLSRGPRGGVRVSYKSLGGSYLRNNTFLDLIQSGYIGTYAADTRTFSVLINEILKGNRGVVAALQTNQPTFTQKETEMPGLSPKDLDSIL